jgi:peptide/nickel transport system ATP-binding protein
MNAPALRIEGLTVRLPSGADRSHAVSDVSLEVRQGELMCLVGESGSGKSVVAYTVMGLLPDNVRATAGRVLLGDEDLLRATPERMRRLRGERMAMIFQEPMTALNPVMRCGAQIDELLAQHTTLRPPSDGRACCACSSTCGCPIPPPSTTPIRISSPAASASAS